MTYHAFRQRGAYGNRIPGLIDPKSLSIGKLNYKTNLISHIDFNDIASLFTDAGGTTNVTSEDDAIYIARDLSGYSNKLAQSTESLRPLYKTNIIGERSTAYWNNDYMKYPPLTVAASSSLTMFLVIRPTYFYATSPGLWRSDSDSQGNDFFIFTNDKRPWVRWGGSDILKPSSGWACSTLSNYLLCWVVSDASSVKFYANGSLEHSNTHAVSTGGFGIYNLGWQFGSDQSVDGYYGEIIFYNEAISDSNREMVENYINGKWNLW